MGLDLKVIFHPTRYNFTPLGGDPSLGMQLKYHLFSYQLNSLLFCC
jgi:hypothetical protein